MVHFVQVFTGGINKVNKQEGNKDEQVMLDWLNVQIKFFLKMSETGVKKVKILERF